MQLFSNHLQMKSYPAERQIAGCTGLVHNALTGIWDVLFCAEIMEFQIPSCAASQWPIFWKNARAETSEVVPNLNPSCVCVCVFAMQLCSFVSGLIVAPEQFLHLPTHAYIHTVCFSLTAHSSRWFFLFPPTNSHAHRPVVYIHFTVWRCRCTSRARP